MANDEAGRLQVQRPTDVIHGDDDREYAGVTRVLTGTDAGSEREYEPGDEALVEAGQAEWVVAPVFHPGAGRRLDGRPGSAEQSAAPRGGVEAYPPAEPTYPDRRTEARVEGVVDASTDSDVEGTISGKRAEAAKADEGRGSDAAEQAKLGGAGARSGPVTSEADNEKLGPKVEEPPAGDSEDSGKTPAKKAASSR